MDCQGNLVFPNNNLSAGEQIERFRLLLPQIIPLAAQPGPWAYRLTAGGLTHVSAAVLHRRLAAQRRRRRAAPDHNAGGR